MFPAAVLSLALATSPAPHPVWTEEDAIRAFLASSPALEEAQAAEASARADVTQAGLLPNPTLNLSGSNIPLRANTTSAGNGPGISRNLVTGVELDQPFELGGKRGRRVAMARGALAEAGLARDDALRTARFELRRAFWNAVRAKEKRSLAEAVKARYAETIRITRARFEGQDISALDLDKVELEGSRQENDLADAVAEERTSLAELLRLVGAGAPPEVEVAGTLAAPAAPLEPAALLARAREARPDLREARQRILTAQAQVASAEAQAVPDVTAGVAWLHSRAVAAGDNPDSLSVVLGLPLPIFHRNQGEVQKARVAVSAAERAAAALEAQVGREVAAALARYAAAREKVARYDGGALARADRALAVAEKTWRAGDRSLLELLEAQRTDIALRADYLDTLFELREARLEVEKAVGAALPEGA